MMTGPPDRWLSLSLLVALILISPEPQRQGQVTVHLIVLACMLGLSLRWRAAPLAMLVLLLVGVDLRLAYLDTTRSDVDEVTRAAIERVLDGQNPYGIGYRVSEPPGSPFPYGPLVLLWYLPWRDPSAADLLVSIFILALLVLRGHPLGAAIYAAAPALLPIASDGSNDTSAGLLLLIALTTAQRWRLFGAFLVGVAIAFKPYALAWAPGLIAWAGAPVLLPLLTGAGILWLPALVAWGPGAIATSLAMAQRIDVDPWYSLGQVLTRFGVMVSRDVLELVRYAAGGATALAVMSSVRSWSGVVVGGILVFLATLFLGYWSTFAYFSAIAPLVCWSIDAWLGYADRRVAWPFDPIGRIGPGSGVAVPARSRA